MATLEQSDFGGGIYRGRKAPANGVYDALNALVDDEGQLFRRGGSAFKSNANTTDNIVGLFDGYLAAGLRTLMWPTATLTAYYLGSDDATPGSLTANTKINPFARAAVVNGVAWIPCSGVGGTPGAGLFAWGGARIAAPNVTAPTVTLTNGSAVMTGTATSWASLYEAGSLVTISGYGVTILTTVKSVDSNTQIMLTEPFSEDTHVDWGAIIQNHSTSSTPIQYVAASGNPARLWVTYGNRAFYSEPGNGAFIEANNYIDLPAPSQIVGADALGDTVVFFTTDGVWTLGNSELDPIDDFGNVQWQQQRISRNVILWGDPGVSAWQAALVVPAVDDVYLLSGDGTTRAISGNRYRGDGGVRSLYRSYVAAGYQPGTAAVHRGHYFLPIVNGTTLVDVLICRLDRGFAWTRWSGHAAGGAYAQRAGATTRNPRLLGIAAKRVTDLTTCLNQAGNASEADGTTHTFTKESNDFDLGPGIRPDTVEKVRYAYETTGGTPTITVSHAVGAEGASYTAAVLKRGGGASDGTDYSAWRVGRKAERVRFKFTTSSAVTSLILRRVELTIRQAGQT